MEISEFPFKRTGLRFAIVAVALLLFQNCGKFGDQARGSSSLQPELPITYVDTPQASNLESPSALPVGATTSTSPGHAPIITEQPVGATAISGTLVELRVSALAPYPMVQWYHNSVPIPGANSGTYQFTLSGSTAGYYAAILFYEDKSFTVSDGVMVNLQRQALPHITTHPQSQSLIGGAATLVAGYNGSPFPQIQWLKDGAAIPGANQATLEVFNPGNYSFYIYNEAGIANSETAVVSAALNSPPPSNASGDIVSFAFAYTYDGEVRLGLAELSGGVASIYAYSGHKNTAFSSSSGELGFSSGSGGSRCSMPILKPYLQASNYTGSYITTVNNFTLSFDNRTLVFARELGLKKSRLLSVNGEANGVIGYGYAGSSSLKQKTMMKSNLQNGIFTTGTDFNHQRGSESFWWPGPLGIYPLPLVASNGNAMALWFIGSDGWSNYDSVALNVDPNNWGIMFRHFGHDFGRLGCNNSDGHTHVMLGFGENNTLEGFMTVELSLNHQGNYISVGRMFKSN